MLEEIGPKPKQEHFPYLNNVVNVEKMYTSSRKRLRNQWVKSRTGPGTICMGLRDPLITSPFLQLS